MFEQDVNFLPRIDMMKPRRLNSAFFGVKCFFDSEPQFGLAKGVWSTVVGYSGGRDEKPSYENLGDHVKVVMVEYDPLAISYGQLLDISLNCCGCREGSRSQCISSIFVKNTFEKRLAQAAIARYKLRMSCEKYVKVMMHKTFHKAEKWCQKHSLRMFPALMDELRQVYPDEEHLIQSTLATRLNGILGHRSTSYVPDDFELYDLSDCAAAILKNAIELREVK